MVKMQILLIEDNFLLREGIVAMLNENGDFKVVSRSADDDAVHQLQNLALPPDVVLLGLGLEKTNSLKLMVLLQEKFPAAKIIAMDILPEHIDIIEFIKAGGDGFILKNAPRNDWIKTVKAVATGVKVLPASMAQSLFNQICEFGLHNGKNISTHPTFTNREREIVDLISTGMSNKEIAESLHIAIYTVKNHVHNILDKSALSSRAQLAAHTGKK